MLNIEKIKNANRIMILGGSASGKSTLAHQLSKKLKIKAYFLDTIYFKPNTFWESVCFSKFLNEHNIICRKRKWIIEGNYSKTMQDRINNADIIIFIRINRFISLFRFLKRFSDNYRHGCPDGCDNKISWSMFKYILWKYPKKAKKVHNMLKGNPKVIILNSFSELIELKKQIGISISKKDFDITKV